MGNICRSPAAEIVLRKLAADTHRSHDFEIDSAGTIGYHKGAPPDPRMAGTLERNGYPVTGRSRKVGVQDLERFDLILAMDEDNLASLHRLDPDGLHTRKIRLFVEFCSKNNDVRVPDPYYGGQRGFNYVLQLLEDGCSGILTFLAPQRIMG